MTLRLKVVNRREFEAELNAQASRVQAQLKRAVRVAANETRNEALTSILQNPRSGPQVTRYNPKRTIRISAPGGPPAGDTGFLANNIHLVMDSDGMGADVESRADYSAALEFGTMDMPARPFLQPALEQGRAKYKRLFTKAVKDGIK
jgi:HK97 gp10 family phage protein